MGSAQNFFFSLVGLDLKKLDECPKPALGLGLAGLIPFASGQHLIPYIILILFLIEKNELNVNVLCFNLIQTCFGIKHTDFLKPHFELIFLIEKQKKCLCSFTTFQSHRHVLY